VIKISFGDGNYFELTEWLSGEIIIGHILKYSKSNNKVWEIFMRCIAKMQEVKAIRGLFLSVFFIGFYGIVDAKPKNVKASCDVDLIAFSYDRPLQLYSFLESVKDYITGLNKTYVLYRVSSNDFDGAYLDVKKKFPEAIFCKQDSQANGADFKEKLKDIFSKKSKSGYVAFGVDDIIVTDFINIGECIGALEKTNAYGFYLRTGKNITERYVTPPQVVSVQKIYEVLPGIFAWKFKDGNGGVWSYPNSVDMTIYRKSDIVDKINNLKYKSPNTLEGLWAKHVDLDLIGLCFEKSKIINIPLNLVQQDWNNKHMDGFSAAKMLDLYQRGFKIDIKQLYGINNRAPHISYEPKFISRD